MSVRSEKEVVLDSAKEVVLDSDKPPSTIIEYQPNVRSKPKRTINDASRRFKDQYFPNVSDVEWCDWRWQLRNRICDIPTLSRFFDFPDPSLLKSSFPFAITPYYLSVCKDNSALLKTVLPSSLENIRSEAESEDPLHEESQSPCQGLVHRYPDRVLFLVTNYCSVACRFCTRSRMVGKEEGKLSRIQWEKSIEYIRNHKEVRDVLISGGDPLTLSNSSLEWILANLRAIEHVEMIRIGSKVPAVLPQRITNSLTSMLKKYHPLFISLHFTHPSEITEETKMACNRLADAGIPLGSQTVLLKDVNDNVLIMKKLIHELLKVRCKPYYIYQLDLVSGTSHFKTKVEKGIEIISGLRGHTSGYAIPTYVIDAPNGGGKIPVAFSNIVEWNDKEIRLKNYENKEFTYELN